MYPQPSYSNSNQTSYNPFNSQVPYQPIQSSLNLQGSKFISSVGNLAENSSSPLKRSDQRASVAPRNPLQSSFKSSRDENRGSQLPVFGSQVSENQAMKPFSVEFISNGQSFVDQNSVRGQERPILINPQPYIEREGPVFVQGNYSQNSSPSNILRRFSYRGQTDQLNFLSRNPGQAAPGSIQQFNSFQRDGHRVTSNSNIYSLINKNY